MLACYALTISALAIYQRQSLNRNCKMSRIKRQNLKSLSHWNMLSRLHPFATTQTRKITTVNKSRSSVCKNWTKLSRFNYMRINSLTGCTHLQQSRKIMKLYKINLNPQRIKRKKRGTLWHRVEVDFQLNSGSKLLTKEELNIWIWRQIMKIYYYKFPPKIEIALSVNNNNLALKKETIWI